MLKQLLSKWILMLLLLSPQASFAFSHFGHQLICATAYDLAAPKTKVFILFGSPLFLSNIKMLGKFKIRFSKKGSIHLSPSKTCSVLKGL